MLALARPALGAEEGHGPSPWLLALQLLNAGILFWILLRYARKPLRDLFIQRRHEIQTSIREAQSRVESAETELARWRGRLAEIDDESARLLREADAQATEERRLALERAKASAVRIREEAQAVGDQEIERARTELRLEAAALATQIAADLVQQNLEPADDRRLVDEAIERIGSGG